MIKVIVNLIFCVLLANGVYALSLGVTTEPSSPGCNNGKIHINISSPCGGAYKVGGGFFLNGVLTYEVGPGTYSFTFFDYCCLNTDAVGNCLDEQNDVQTITATVTENVCMVNGSVSVLSNAGEFLCNNGSVSVTSVSNTCGVVWNHLLKDGVSYDVHIGLSPGIDTFTFFNLAAGNYTLATYNLFCTDTSYFTITENPCDVNVAIQNANVITGSVPCNNGQITFQSNSGTCIATYHNSWLLQDNNLVPYSVYYYPSGSNQTYYNLPAGEYKIIVSVPGYCYDTSSAITISTGPCNTHIVIDSMSQVNTVCNSGCVFFHLNTNACNPFLTTILNNGILVNSQLTSQGNVYSFDNLSDGNYTIITTDGYCSDTIHNLVISPCSNINCTIKAYIQGYYAYGGYMNSTLYNQGLLQYPSYTDSILVVLRDANAPYTITYQAMGLLQLDGYIHLLLPTQLFNNSHYITLKHRNAVETWSANPIILNGNTNYDFTTAANKAYGDNQAEVEPGIFALFSGDINQDGYIDSFDFPLLDTDIFNGESGFYVNTDLNGDGFVDSFDFPVFDVNSFNGVGVMMP